MSTSKIYTTNTESMKATGVAGLEYMFGHDVEGIKPTNYLSPAAELDFERASTALGLDVINIMQASFLQGLVSLIPLRPNGQIYKKPQIIVYDPESGRLVSDTLRSKLTTVDGISVKTMTCKGKKFDESFTVKDDHEREGEPWISNLNYSLTTFDGIWLDITELEYTSFAKPQGKEDSPRRFSVILRPERYQIRLFYRSGEGYDSVEFTYNQDRDLTRVEIRKNGQMPSQNWPPGLEEELHGLATNENKTLTVNGKFVDKLLDHVLGTTHRGISLDRTVEETVRGFMNRTVREVGDIVVFETPEFIAPEEKPFEPPKSSYKPPKPWKPSDDSL